MKWNMVFGALVVSVGLCSQSFGFELLERMLGLNDCGCNSCCQQACQPSCGCDKGCEPAARQMRAVRLRAARPRRVRLPRAVRPRRAVPSSRAVRRSAASQNAATTTAVAVCSVACTTSCSVAAATSRLLQQLQQLVAVVLPPRAVPRLVKLRLVRLLPSCECAAAPSCAAASCLRLRFALQLVLRKKLLPQAPLPRRSAQLPA